MSQTVLLVYPEPYFAGGGGISTYLKNTISAHTAAGLNVKLLTWASGVDSWFVAEPTDEELLPLRREDVIFIKLTEEQIFSVNPICTRAKNISDLLVSHICKAVRIFAPDLIETSDYSAGIHSYIENVRAGIITDAPPIAVFNHGMLSNIWPASALLPSDYSVRELVLEEQIVEWADVLICPSDFAANNMRKLRKHGDVVVIREPYQSQWRTQEKFQAKRFAFLGRVSFAKGVDKVAALLTAAAATTEIDHVAFIGRVVETPFRQPDAEKLVRSRVPATMRDKIEFCGALHRDQVASKLSDYGYCINFSRSETFSYTCLESISAGVAPLVMLDSPMAEFIPEEHRHLLTFAEAPHRQAVVREVLENWEKNYRELMPIIQAHARELTSFERFSSAYSSMIRDLRPDHNKGTYQNIYKSSDVSVLISTFNDADVLVAALESVFQQTRSVAEIIILNDGSDQPDKVAILNKLSSDKRIKLINVANMGLVAARNVLVENCSTQLCIFMDSDDLIEADYVERCLAALNSAPDRWSAALTRRKNFGLNDHEHSGNLLGSPAHWIMNDFRMTALIKASVLREIRFKPEMRNGEADDWWWWLRFSLSGYEATFVPLPLFRYRTEQGSMSIPWSEGQASLTADLLCDLACQAARNGKDVGNILQIALRTAYQLRRENDILRTCNHSSYDESTPQAFNDNFHQWQFLEASMQRYLGTKLGWKVARKVERIVLMHPVLRKGARLMLRQVSVLRR